jgi:hypothetical protein
MRWDLCPSGGVRDGDCDHCLGLGPSSLGWRNVLRTRHRPAAADAPDGDESHDPDGPTGAMADTDFQLLLSQAEANIAPKPPPWYVPLGAPTASDIIAEANALKNAHTQRVLNMAVMDMRLGMEIGAIFNSDELWVKLKEIEPQASPLLRIMHSTICNFVADQTISFSLLAQGLVFREERTAAEEHLAEIVRSWKASHFRQGQGDLIRTLTADAMSGMVAVYHAPDPGNDRTGQRLYRVDPKVVFPVFGRDGTNAVYTVYDATFTEVMRDFGDGVDPTTGKDNPVTAAIKKAARTGQGQGNKRIDVDITKEFIGYWDRERVILTWGGETIKTDTHDLWVCPWHIGIPNWRQTAGAKSSHSDVEVGGNRPGPRVESGGISLPYDQAATSSPQRDLARLYEPFLLPWLTVVDKVEKAQTRLGYALDRSLNARASSATRPAGASTATPTPARPGRRRNRQRRRARAPTRPAARRREAEPRERRADPGRAAGARPLARPPRPGPRRRRAPARRPVPRRASGSARAAPPRGAPRRAPADCRYASSIAGPSIGGGARLAVRPRPALARHDRRGPPSARVATFARLGAEPGRIVDVDVAPFAAARGLVIALPTRVTAVGGTGEAAGPVTWPIRILGRREWLRAARSSWRG